MWIGCCCCFGLCAAACWFIAVTNARKTAHVLVVSVSTETRLHNDATVLEFILARTCTERQYAIKKSTTNFFRMPQWWNNVLNPCSSELSTDGRNRYTDRKLLFLSKLRAITHHFPAVDLTTKSMGSRATVSYHRVSRITPSLGATITSTPKCRV
jgi:hypothetical protein